MDNNSNTYRISNKDLLESINKHIQELAEATDQARTSAEMLRYLDSCSKFHQYSPFNVWSILLARPKATCVAGFQKWLKLNRYVKKGEKGIPILAPIIIKKAKEETPDDESLVGFKVVYVFDVSQTEGDPLPEPPDWKSPAKNAMLNARLIEFANHRGISVSIKELDGDIQGVSRGGLVEIDPTAGTKTLIHEIAHELMHRGKDRPEDPAIREIEAESVAYVVAKHFGLEGLNSPNYIAFHNGKPASIMVKLNRISQIVLEIINSCM